MAVPPPAGDSGEGLAALLATREMVIVCGSGGTGKTTVSAALGAIAAARLGGRVLVLTVDPARRLATALGLGDAGVGHTATRVDLRALTRSGIAGGGPTVKGGELWVAMLDTKAGWDDLIRRHAPDAQVRDQVLANPLYANITGRFVHSHGYIAMERLLELHASGEYDLVVIDTPPSRNALELLDAPKRMREFFGSRLLRWLTVPYRSRLFTAASKPFYSLADRVLGSRFLQDIAEFFVLFQTMERGFVTRATEVERVLSDARTAFVVVSTLDAAPVHEAAFLVAELERRSMHVGGLVLNRALPSEIRSRGAIRAADRLVDAAADRGVTTPLGDAIGAEPEAVGAILAEVGHRFADIAVVADREAQRRAELSALVSPCVTVPALARDVNDLAALAELGRHLIDGPEP